MFRKVIYLDNAKLNDYMAIATDKKVAKVDTMHITNDKDIGLDLRIISAGAKGTKSFEANILSSLLHDIDEFEREIKNREDFFNFQTKTGLDLNTIPRGSIIKFDTYIYIPEEFDFVQLIEQFKPMLSNEITSKMGEQESAAFEKFFETHNPKLPVVSELLEYSLCSLIETEYLKVEYTDLEEYESTEVTIFSKSSFK